MKHFRWQAIGIVLMLALSVTSCSKRNVKVTTPLTCNCEQPATPSKSSADVVCADPSVPESTPVKVPEYGLLKLAQWSDVEELKQDDLTASWNAWLTSCSGLKNKPDWQTACQAAKSLNAPTQADIINYFAQYFDVYSTRSVAGESTGLVTGYYQPLLRGSRTKSSKYAFPLYGQPKDLITVDLSALFPELKYKRVRGKLDGNKLVPYYTRAEIESATPPLSGNEIVWVDDELDAFYLQIQGSGLIKLNTGEQMHLGYADQNGHTYNSIGKVLVQRGEMTASQASMQGIKDWAKKNVGKLRELLNSNPSYVFFRELPGNLPGPLGALGVPLTAERSIAVDPKYIPLGAPVFLSTTYPNSNKPLKRMMMAQDTGGAIKDGIRADFYWGTGHEAGKMAGSMKQSGQMWVLLPKGFKLPSIN
jgi:membrane-bound lytic murein transglycosylase A